MSPGRGDLHLKGMETLVAKVSSEAPEDSELVRRVLAGEVALFELLMRRNNQRVYRAVRSLIRDETEVEDVMQQAYVAAYSKLSQFQGSAQFSTWLVRIAVNEALMRLRQARKFVALDGGPQEDAVSQDRKPTPEEATARRELVALLERAVDALPDIYRTAFVLRDVEGLSTAETAAALETSEDVIKTRLHRAKAALRDKMNELLDAQAREAFSFHAVRCDRVVNSVMKRIREG